MTLVKVVGQFRMNITREDPTSAPSKFWPLVDCTSVVVLCVSEDDPHSITERNCVLRGDPAFTWMVSAGSQSQPWFAVQYPG